MKNKWLVASTVLAGIFTARAGDLMINYFDRSGLLSFQEIPAAASYRVEWVTNLNSATWSSNAPGLPVVPSSGPGTLTVTVGVFHAACYFRVVATVTNVSSNALTNTFDLSNEGWNVVDYPFRSHKPAPAMSALPFDAAIGNPPGSVRVVDVYSETGIAAPAHYLGDRLAFYGGNLAYDIYLRYTDGITHPAVVLNGGTKSVYYDAASPPLNEWQRRIVPLSESGWKISGSGVAATEMDFKAVLSNLVGLYIYTEWNSGPDDTNVDNIALTPP